MGQHTTEGDGRADQGVQFFITPDSELQVARGDTLDLEILGGVPGELEDFSCEVFKDGSNVDGG